MQFGDYTMNALVYLCINQHMKFEVPSFWQLKRYDWGKIKKKTGHLVHADS